MIGLSIYLIIGAALYFWNIRLIKNSPWYHYPILFVGMTFFWLPGILFMIPVSMKKFM